MAKQTGAVVVTGASTGIGRATALYLDQKGYRVFAGVRKSSDANRLKKEGSKKLTPITIDVTKPRSIATARQKVQRAVGKKGLAGLVNNAGIAGAGPIEHLPVEEFEKVIDVNLTGQYRVSQEFLPLVRKGEGTIVFITSIGGLIASPFFSPYNAAKFGLEGLADSLRRELRPWKKMKVVVVEPGSIATPIWDKGTAAVDEVSAKMRPGYQKLYGKQMQVMRKVSTETAERGLEPLEVAEVVEKAIRKRRPKTRYIVGRDAKMMKRTSGLVGDKNFDRLMHRQMGMPNEVPSGR